MAIQPQVRPVLLPSLKIVGTVALPAIILLRFGPALIRLKLFTVFPATLLLLCLEKSCSRCITEGEILRFMMAANLAMLVYAWIAVNWLFLPVVVMVVVLAVQLLLWSIRRIIPANTAIAM